MTWPEDLQKLLMISLNITILVNKELMKNGTIIKKRSDKGGAFIEMITGSRILWSTWWCMMEDKISSQIMNTYGTYGRSPCLILAWGSETWDRPPLII